MTAENGNSLDSFNCRQNLEVGGVSYEYFGLTKAEENGLDGVSKLPFSLRVLLENLLRNEDGGTVTRDDIEAVAAWLKEKTSTHEIAYRPARVLMQDFTGVPAVVDLAAMRDAMETLGGDPAKINPLVPVDLVIDHSVMVDFFGTGDAFKLNVEKEYERNKERYEFLKWGAEAFSNFRVVPPGTGICHQVNLEYLAQTVWTKDVVHGGKKVTQAFPDTCVGTDSHTTMINGLSVLGWGVGGIEAEAAMLGQPISMVIPDVVGMRFNGQLKEGVTATDLVLTVTEVLRKHGVVGKFVEFCGPGLDHLSLEDRATIANMAPEYGATCGFFPIDKETLSYLHATGRAKDNIALVKAYSRAQGVFRTADTADPEFTDTIEFDLSSVVPSIAGPKRPQDRVELSSAADSFARAVTQIREKSSKSKTDLSQDASVGVKDADYKLRDGHVVIAAITSCTNTSNPSVLVTAGLLARNARARGLDVKPWVKTSLAPGSQVVTDYLSRSGLQEDLDALGFDLVGYGCTTCIGNSGPLPENISKAVTDNDLIVCSVLSGNRNFEGRVNPDVRANYLASPPLVVAYALAGTMTTNLTREPIGEDRGGQSVYLKDIWPTSQEISEVVRESISPDLFETRYGDVFKGDKDWQEMGTSTTAGLTYGWNPTSTYVRSPPYFEDLKPEPQPAGDILDARILGLFLDSITTDHISPAGAIKADGPAGHYLVEHQVPPRNFNSFGSRRGNHEVMMRGTFGNIRIANQMVPGTQGGKTIHYPSGEQMSIFEAAMRYKSEGVPLVVFAGKDYGMGSSRDWAAKGTRLLGVRAVIAETFERIHRSNLVGMGVLPFEFMDGQTWQSLELSGQETVTIGDLERIKPGQETVAKIKSEDGKTKLVSIRCRIDTLDELAYYKNGGILPFVLRKLRAAA